MKSLDKASLLYALLAIFLWSTVASAFKIALAGLSPLHLLGIASWTSVVVFIFVLVLQGKVRELLSQNSQDWLRSAGMGAMYPLLYYLLLFSAYERLPAQQAQPLNYTWPILFALLSIPLLGRTLTKEDLIGLLVSFTGVIIISLGGHSDRPGTINPPGLIMALGSGLVWALFWILNLRDRRDPMIKLTTSFLLGAIYVSLLMGPFPFPQSLSLRSLSSAVYVGLFEMGFTFVLWMKALETTGQQILIGNLAYLSPFLSLVFIHFVLGEEIHFSSLTGLGLIVAGIVIQATATRRDI